MGKWNDVKIVKSRTISINIKKGPITSMFLTLNGYNHGRTNVVPPSLVPLTQIAPSPPPAPPTQIAPSPPPQVEFQPQPPQQPFLPTLPALPHARPLPFQYPLPLAPSRIPSFPPNPRSFALLPIPAAQSIQNAKLIRKVSKNYNQDMKYDGTSNHFDYKLTISHNIYKRVKLSREAYIRAFLIILKGLAEIYYFNNMLS